MTTAEQLPQALTLLGTWQRSLEAGDLGAARQAVAAMQALVARERPRKHRATPSERGSRATSA
jgi:hypothetical protein